MSRWSMHSPLSPPHSPSWEQILAQPMHSYTTPLPLIPHTTPHSLHLHPLLVHLVLALSVTAYALHLLSPNRAQYTRARCNRPASWLIFGAAISTPPNSPAKPSSIDFQADFGNISANSEFQPPKSNRKVLSTPISGPNVRPNFKN